MGMLLRRGLVLALCSSAFAFAREAHAQEVAVQAPVTACIDLLLLDAIPANLEWTYWVTGGGGFHSDRTNERFGVLGFGMESTSSIFETSRKYQYGGPYEFRGGSWWNMTSDMSGMRAEGGFLFSFGQVNHAQWGTYAVRVGGGMGDDRLGLSPHFVLTLTGGIRSALGRYHERGACDPEPAPKAIDRADTFRLFATTRSTLAKDAPWQFTFGVEFSPSFFLPPYGLGKWIGARP